MGRVRRGETTRFVVGQQKGYVTTGHDAGGALGEVMIRVAKQGSTLAGVMDAFGVALSAGLQHGAPLDEYVASLAGTRFPPAGPTDDAELPQATSIVDYLVRRVALDATSPSAMR